MMKPAVDTRQREELKTPFIRAGWELRALHEGDYEVYDSVGTPVLIEHKTVKKLLDDMSSGVLQSQARRLTEATDFPILLVEGHWSVDHEGYLPDGRHTWEQCWNMLQSLQDIGLRLQLTSSLNHTIERIFELEEYYAKAFHSSIARHPSGDVRLSVLSHIHGIDKSKGLAVLEVYPTLQDVAEALVEDLMRVDGVGPKLANRIYRFWRDEAAVR